MSNAEREAIVVLFIRTTAVDPDPRVEREVAWITEMADSVKILAWDREGRSLARECKGKVTIVRSRFTAGHGRGLRNIFGFAAFNWAVLWHLLTQPVSLVHACDLDTVLPAIIASKFKKIRVIYDIFDFYSESRKIGIFRPVIKAIDYWAMRQVDSILIAHESRMQQLEANGEQLKSKVSVIYNTPEDVPIVKAAGQSPYFSYVGILELDRGIVEVVQAVEQVAGARVLIAGFGLLAESLRETANLSRTVEFLGRVDYQKAMTIQGNSLAIFALYDPRIPNNRLAAPNKLYEAMCLGKPIITSEGTIMADFVKRERIGFIVPYGNVEALQKRITFCMQNEEMLAAMGERARCLYERKYSGAAMKRELQRVYFTALRTIGGSNGETAYEK